MERHRPLKRRKGLKSASATRSQGREARLWRVLQEHPLARFGFQRRGRLGPFHADIVCPGARLAVLVEDCPLPGRVEWLEAAGYRVLTFTKAEASNPDAVLDVIARLFELHAVHKPE